MHSSNSSLCWRNHAQNNTTVLSSRKEIWENFPVSLVQLGKDANDQAERHAVVWNRKNIVEWRQSCPDPNSWYMYEKNVEAKLMQELRRSTKWFVEPRRQDDQICVIRMAFKSARMPTARPSPNYTEQIPILTRIKDIQTFFPMVIWHEVSPKTFSIQLSCAKMKNVPNAAQLSYNLYRALKASTAWAVLPGESTEMCRIVLS